MTRPVLLVGHSCGCLVLLGFLFLTMNYFPAIATPVYDARALPLRENFDPAEANPERNITCLGDSIDLRLPILANGFDPNGVSMQMLCAKPQYNGGQPDQHAGGYCFETPSSGTGSTGEVGFDQTPAARANAQLQNPRILLACFHRCFCNFRSRDTSRQPKSCWPYSNTALRQSRTTYELQLDVNDDLTTPRAQKTGKRGDLKVLSGAMIMYSELALAHLWAGLWRRPFISLDPGNEIECQGGLPTFNLPAPYRTIDFENLQQMCAMQLSGGKMEANAGGYCHRSDTDAGPINTVWFSDDTTPRLDWTWAGGNFFASASIRFWCWQRCACKSSPTKDEATTSLWAFIKNHELTYRSDGSVDIQATGPVPKGQPRRTQVLPPQGGAGSPSGSCGANKTTFCPQPWDESMYGPVPRAPWDSTDLVKPAPPSSNATVCGNKCNGTTDCASPDPAGFNCACALPTSADARTLGLDPVAPVAICIALFASSSKSNSLGGKRELLNGQASALDVKSLQRYEDEKGLPYTCKCNATFTADQCCESRDGIIHLT